MYLALVYHLATRYRVKVRDDKFAEASNYSMEVIEGQIATWEEGVALI